MKYIWLGIKDYCRDCWHDWLLKHINRFPECQVYAASYKGDNTKEIHYVLWDRFWKEGTLWHYIQQRKAAKLLKEIKTLQKELKQKDVK